MIKSLSASEIVDDYLKRYLFIDYWENSTELPDINVDSLDRVEFQLHVEEFTGKTVEDHDAIIGCKTIEDLVNFVEVVLSHEER
jgi:acyl carrier protein